MNKISVKNIIVSPSGQLYGSENVLLDFLNGSVSEYEIYAPDHSVFYKKLIDENYQVQGFTNLKWLYFKLYFKLLFLKKSLYLNEAGHMSYITILARLLPTRKFVVSVRLLEDCNIKLKKIPKNITLIPVSNYIKNSIRTNANLKVVYDPYKLSDKEMDIKPFNKDGGLLIGIVGRVSQTKGLDDVISLIKRIKIEKRERVTFLFYGSYDQNSKWFINFKSDLDSIEFLKYDFKGFTKDQSLIYNNCDLILHLNKVEALGRIIFESIDNCIPFLCYNMGGSGELAKTLGLSNCTINITSNHISELALRIEDSIGNLKMDKNDFINAKLIIIEKFNPRNYAIQIEKYL